jgi:sec-independent protein translocase protein TatA
MHSMGVELFTPVHLLFLGILALLLFGPKRLPEIGRSLGNGIREFKSTVDGLGVTDAVHSANEVRSAVSPTNIARAAIPGVAEAQDTMKAVKGEDQASASASPAGGTGAVMSRSSADDGE